jgi:multidrug efflux pump subunit AcrB
MRIKHPLTGAMVALITPMFKESGTMTDVDNLMRDEYPVINFQVDTAKASRFGVSVQTIKETLAMAMSNYWTQYWWSRWHFNHSVISPCIKCNLLNQFTRM